MTRRHGVLAAALLAVSLSIPATAAEKTTPPTPILWQDPGSIGSRDLFHGIGGKDNVPTAPFTYHKEERGGTSPKFSIEDSAGRKWTAKIGLEAQPEVAATRLLWAVGYFTNEDYLVPDMTAEGLKHQKRGKELKEAPDRVPNVRLQRRPDEAKKVADWSWRKNPFKNTRELNGLRVMMALLNNWDLKDDNNAVLVEKDKSEHAMYEVSDVGASFGTSGKSTSDTVSKNNIEAYRKHKFIARVHKKTVDFNFPTHPSIVHVFEFPFVWRSLRNRWIGRGIPREDAKWIGSLLGQLSHEQIRDAFRAANYTPEKIDTYTEAVEKRIAELQKL